MRRIQDRYNPAESKKLILIAEHDDGKRELLEKVLSKDYNVVCSSCGKETFDLIRQHLETLSVVLLDLNMPDMSGLDLLQQIKKDENTETVPVIALTSEQNSEVECLKYGADDFIHVPFPRTEIVLARVLRIIELSEDRQIIRSTERDTLTGLYNKEYFYNYAKRFDARFPDKRMDAIIVDINHFRTLNERFGTAYGDEVLKRLSGILRKLARENEGMVCRRGADTFMIYCTHMKSHKAFLDDVLTHYAAVNTENIKIRLRMGVYENVDKAVAVDRRFDRAEMASDNISNIYAKNIEIYDETFHKKELYAERLLDDFAQAIKDRQFVVFYQPKFDVRPSKPVLASAEALVRWNHPEFGMLSPAVFISLLEGNGLIEELDRYVWEEAARQIVEWKKKYGFVLPVSVNVSRIDMYDPELIDTFKSIISRNDLCPEDLLLEITESAYTSDSTHLIEVVGELRKLGFRIEMDDFGSGYSSLNMLSTLPIDALKIDMQLVRTAFSHKDTRMLEIILEISDFMTVPVIAEGVESEDQMQTLKAIGCDFVQGYCFSKPVPAPEFDAFMQERRKIDYTAYSFTDGQTRKKSSRAHNRIAQVLFGGYDSIYYIDVITDRYMQFASDGVYKKLQIEHSGVNFFAEAIANTELFVHEDDRARVRDFLQKDALLKQLVNDKSLMFTYRLLIDGVGVYYTMKVVKADTYDDHHIVIGVSNIDDQVRQVFKCEGILLDRIDGCSC